MSYYEIPCKSTITQELLEIAKNDDPWYTHLSIEMKPVSMDLLTMDPLFNFLSSRYKCQGHVWRFRPFTCFDWHRDKSRTSAINIVLTPWVRSYSVFSESKKDYMLRTSDYVFDIEDLVYRPDTYYVLSTQTPHTVFNFEETRYLLSVDFLEEDMYIPFKDMVSVIEKEFNS